MLRRDKTSDMYFMKMNAQEKMTLVPLHVSNQRGWRQRQYHEHTCQDKSTLDGIEASKGTPVEE